MLKAALGGEPSPTAASTGPAESSSSLRTSTFPIRFGDYELIEEIAHGGMGIVYRARQINLDRIVAVKRLLLGALASPEYVQRFRTEAAAAASLQHPHIVAIHEVGFHDGQHFFAMDYVAGRSLADLVRDGPLPAQRAARYVKTIAQAIHYAHERNILHRDLKPSNVLIDDQDQPRVTDFGLAKRLEKDSDLTLSGQVLGSPNYMPPEQAAAHRGLVGKRSDVYSLGAILYNLLTGRPPFVAPTVAETLQQVQNAEPLSPTVLNPHLPRDLKTICLKCLEKEPARRYQSAQELADELERFLDRKPILARPISRPEKLWRWCRRKPLVASLSAAVAVVFVAGFAGVAWQWRRAENSARSERREHLLAEGRLYDSLLREARATRVARRVGYRDEVFALLQQAHALDMPHRDLLELRREAVACLGDFVGLTPTTFTDFPTNTLIRLLALDPTGGLAAFGLSDGTILLRELPSGREVGRLNGEFPARSLCFNAAGERLFSLHTPRALSAQEDLAGSVACVWALSTDGRWGEAERRALPGAMECLSIVNGVYFILADVAKHSLALLDAKTRVAVHRVEYPKEMSWLPAVALSPDGQFLAVEMVAPREPNLSVLDIRDLMSGQHVHRFDEPLARFTDLRFSPDGRYLALLSESGASVYAMEGFHRLGEIKEHFPRETAAAFAPDSTMMSLPVIQQTRVRLWNLVRNETIASLEELDGVAQCAFAPDASFLLTAGERHARFYRLRLTAEKVGFAGHAGGVSGVAFSPDGTRLASGGKDRRIKVWDASTGRVDWEHGPLPGPAQCAAYSPDGRLLVTADSETQLVWLWDCQTRARLLELGTNAPGTTWSVQFSRDGRYLVAAGAGSTLEYGIRVWAMNRHSAAASESRLEVKLVKSLEARVVSLALAPDGRHLACASMPEPETDVTWHLWDTFDEQPPRRLPLAPMRWNLQGGSFTPDSRQVLVADSQRKVVSFDAFTGTEVSSFPTLDATRQRASLRYVGAVCLSPDGAKLALARSPSNLSVDVWDPLSGRMLYSLPEQYGTVWWLAWSPDSRRLAISRSNGDIAIWNLPGVERVLAQLGLKATEAVTKR